MDETVKVGLCVSAAMIVALGIVAGVVRCNSDNQATMRACLSSGRSAIECAAAVKAGGIQ